MRREPSHELLQTAFVKLARSNRESTCLSLGQRIKAELGYGYPRPGDRRDQQGESASGGLAGVESRGGVCRRALGGVFLARAPYSRSDDNRDTGRVGGYGGHRRGSDHVRDSGANHVARDGGECLFVSNRRSHHETRFLDVDCLWSMMDSLSACMRRRGRSNFGLCLRITLRSSCCGRY